LAHFTNSSALGKKVRSPAVNGSIVSGMGNEPCWASWQIPITCALTVISVVENPDGGAADAVPVITLMAVQTAMSHKIFFTDNHLLSTNSH
jgi:hypothetical protein